MKTIKYSIFFSVLTAVVFTSCEKVLTDIDLGGFESKLVLNGLLYNNSAVNINVGKTLYITDTDENTSVKNAEIFLSDKNNNAYSFNYDTVGYYSAQDSLIPGNEYSLRVSAGGFETANVFFTFPEKPLISDVDTILEQDKDEDCEYCSVSNALKMTFNLHGTDTRKEYFMISLVHKDTVYYNWKHDPDADTGYKEYLEEPEVYANPFQIGSINPEMKMTLSYHYPEEVLNDGYLCEGEYLFFEKPEGSKMLKVFLKADYIYLGSPNYLRVAKINEAYFKHQLSLARMEYAEFDPLSEKVSIFSNVENGQGVISGINMTEVLVNLPYNTEQY